MSLSKTILVFSLLICFAVWAKFDKTGGGGGSFTGGALSSAITLNNTTTNPTAAGSCIWNTNFNGLVCGDGTNARLICPPQGEENGNATITITLTDCGKTIWTSVDGTTTINLPAASTTIKGFYVCLVKATDSNDMTIDPNSTETLNNSATSKTLPDGGDNICLYSDGDEWFGGPQFVNSY